MYLYTLAFTIDIALPIAKEQSVILTLFYSRQ